MIILGVILLVLGLVVHSSLLLTLGIIVLVVGAALALAGSLGRGIGGRTHYY
ncbi:MAG: DUF6131 family protein [bacterium]